MTPVEAETLVRGIAQFIKDPGEESQAIALAHAYFEQCRLVNQRLDRCAAILAAGDPQQALQLAEASPPVLDLVSILAFREAKAWRAYCQAHQFPVPSVFPEKTVRELNALCGSGAARQHAAYGDYRAAMFRRDDLAALTALRRIARANPEDANALGELPKVEERVRQAALRAIEPLVARQDAPAVATELDRLEALLLSSPPRGGVWTEAQRLRCRHVIRQLAALRDVEASDPAAELIERIESLRNLHHFDLSAEDSREVEGVRSWIEQQRQAAAVSVCCEETVSGMVRLLDACTEHSRSTGSRPLSELRSCLGSLMRFHQELDRLGRALPESLQPRFDRIVRSLNVQIGRRMRLRRNVTLGTVTLLVLSSGGFAAHQLAQYRAGQLAASLDRMVSGREVVSAERLLGRIRSAGPSPHRSPALQSAVLSAETLVHRERGLREGFDALLDGLGTAERDGFRSLPLGTVEEQARLAERQWTELAPDFQAEARTRLVAFQQAWEAHLHDTRADRDEAFLRQLAGVEQRAAGLRNEAGPDEIRTCLTQLRPVLDRLGTLASAEIASLRLAPALADRFVSVRTRAEDFARELEAWDRFQPVLRRPVSLESYLEAVEWARNSRFVEAAPARAAMDLLSLRPSLNNLKMALIFPGQSEASLPDLDQAQLSLMPGEVQEAERLLWSQLCEDEHIHRLRQCELQVLSPGGGTLSRRTVWSKGSVDGSPGLTQAATLYDPERSQAALLFQREVFRRFQAELHDGGPAPEAAAFVRAGLHDLIHGTPSRFRRPLLQCLDLLNTETEVSSVFRAFLALRLHRIMELQPGAWGVPWAPALAAHRQRLIELGAADIQSGDWLVPDVNRRLAARLEEHFRLARQVSYVRQARHLQPAILRAYREGFAFAGFVDAAGHLVLADAGEVTRELWGWRRDTRAPGRVLGTDAALPPKGAVDAALPWTPVFVFRGDPSAILRSNSEASSAEAISMRPYLPPLFQPPS